MKDTLALDNGMLLKRFEKQDDVTEFPKGKFETIRLGSIVIGRPRAGQEKQMKRTWTIIGVADVARSCNWYQSLFGQSKTAPAHDDFGQIVDADGTVLLCLHQWGAHDHPPLTSPDHAQPGNGLLLFFRVDDFVGTLRRARSLVAEFEEGPHLSASTGTMEFALRDLDGYYVMVSALDAT